MKKDKRNPKVEAQLRAELQAEVQSTVIEPFNPEIYKKSEAQRQEIKRAKSMWKASNKR